jgi:hypothetical protein
MKAWHFTKLDKRLGYEDGRLVEAGKILSVRGPLTLCRRGLHASATIFDALKYAPGPYLWRVELMGDVIKDTDKAVASQAQGYLRL